MSLNEQKPLSFWALNPMVTLGGGRGAAGGKKGEEETGKERVGKEGSTRKGREGVQLMGPQYLCQVDAYNYCECQFV